MEKDEITSLLAKIGEGDPAAPEQLLPVVYEDLRRLAAAYFANERSDHTLQPTALVHEAYMRLVNWENVSWQNRAHFFALAAKVMRKVLIDHARRRNARKRGAAATIRLEEAVSFSGPRDLDLVRLEEALTAIEKIDPRQAKIVELRFFGGLSIPETAGYLGISETTVRRDWTFAKAWFQRELSQS